MRNMVDLFVWNLEYIPQEARRVFAHHNKLILTCGYFFHDEALVEVWLTKNCMKSCYYGHFQVLQKPQDMIAGFPSKDSIFVLQTHDIDLGCIEKLRGSLIRR